MNKLLAFFRRLPFTVGALCAWGASAGFNGLFGLKLGGDKLELQVLWVMLFLAFDIMKGGAGLKLMSAWRAGDWLRVLLAAGLLTAGTTMSLIAAFQWRVLAKAEADATRQQVIEAREALRVTIEQDRVKASQLQARDLGVIEADIAKLKLDKRYKRSIACTDATLSDSRALCVQLAALEGERTTAAERVYREKAVVDNEKKRDALKVPTATKDPMAASMTTLLAMMGVKADLDQLSDLVAALVTLLAEFGSVVGPMLAGGEAPSAARRKAGRPWFKPRWPHIAQGAIGQYPKEAFVPADGRTMDRDNAMYWLVNRAATDERVRWDGEAIVATNKQLAAVWGRPTSTVNDWLSHWHAEGIIRKQATAKGTRIFILMTA